MKATSAEANRIGRMLDMIFFKGRLTLNCPLNIFEIFSNP